MRDTTIVFISLVVLKFLGFLNISIQSYLLAKEEFGQLSFLLFFISVTILFGSIGVPLAIVKVLAQYNKNKAKQSILLSVAFLLLICSSSIISLLIILFAGPISDFYNVSKTSISLVGIATITSSFSAFLSGIFRGYQRMIDYSLFNVAISGTLVIISIVLIPLLGIEGALWALILSHLILIIFGILRLKLPIGPMSIIKGELKPFVLFSIPIVATALILTPAHFFGRSLLIATSSAEEAYSQLGDFQIAITIVGLSTIVYTAISIPYLPLISAIDAENRKQRDMIFSRFYSISLVVNFGMVTCLMLAAPLLMLLFKQEYSSSLELVPYVGYYYYLLGITQILGFTFLGTGKVWLRLMINGFWAITVIISFFFLIPRFDIWGLIVSLMVAYSVLAIVSYGYCHRYYNISGKALLTIGMASTVLFLPLLLYNYSGLVYIFLSFISGSVIIIICYYLVDVEDRIMIIGFIVKIYKRIIPF